MAKVTAETFDKNIKTLTSSVKKVKELSHEMVVFGISHAQKTGDCVYLNRTNKVLTKGMQSSLKRYIVACCAQDVDDVETSFITVKGGEYIINTDVKRVVFYRDKEKTVNLGEHGHKLVHYPSFHDIDPDKVKNPFDTTSFIKSMNSLIARAEKDGAQVESKVIQFAKEAAKRMANAEASVTTPEGEIIEEMEA